MNETFEFKSGYSGWYLTLNLICVAIIITICVGNIVNYSQTLDDPTTANNGWLITLITMNSILLLCALLYAGFYTVKWIRERNQTLDTKVKELMKVINPNNEPLIKIDEKSLNSVAIDKLSEISDGDSKLAYKILNRAVQRQKERIVGLNEEGEVIFERIESEDFKNKLKNEFKQYTDQELEELEERKKYKNELSELKEQESKLSTARKVQELKAKNDAKIKRDQEALKLKDEYIEQKLIDEEYFRRQEDKAQLELDKLKYKSDIGKQELLRQKRINKIEESQRNLINKMNNGATALQALNEAKAEAQKSGDSVTIVEEAGANLGIFQRGFNEVKNLYNRFFSKSIENGLNKNQAAEVAESGVRVAEEVISNGGTVEEAIYAVMNTIDKINLEYEYARLDNTELPENAILKSRGGSLYSRNTKYDKESLLKKYGTRRNIYQQTNDFEFSVTSA